MTNRGEPSLGAPHADDGIGSVGYDDDGVKSMKWPLVKEGVLVGLQTNRETAHYLGENFSRGCTFGNSWRDYPFLRMPNVHLEPGSANSLSYFINTTFNYPTMAEAYRVAALNGYNRLF